MTPTLTGAARSARKLREEVRAEVILLRDETAQKDFVAAHQELIDADVVAELTAWVPKLIKTQPSGAMAVADCAVLLAYHLQDSESKGLAFRAKANVFHAVGQNQVALELHDRARELFASAGNVTQVARTLSASIQPLILVGDYDRAYSAAAEASRIFKEQGNEWRLARVEVNTGNIFDRQDRFEEALECYERAYQRLLPHQAKDSEAVAVALHNIAGCLVFLNDFRRAVATYEKARTYAIENDLPVLLGQADYNLAWLHYLRGEYSRAISMLRSTRDACELSGDRHHFALCHLDLSEIYLELNMSREAEEAANEAQSNFRHLGMWYEVAKSLANVAIALSQQAKATEALEVFARARAIFEDEKNNVWCSLIDLYRAIALYTAHRDDEAAVLAASALQFFSGSPLSTKAVLCRILLTRIHFRANRLPAALRECNRALRTLKKLESPVLSCRAHGLMAQIQKSLGRSTQSYEAFQHAKESLELLRSGVRGDELKISIMRDYVEIYEGLVELCIDGDGDDWEAFSYIEQAKSRSLFDRLTNSQPGVALQPRQESKVFRRIQELREELSWYYHRAELAQLNSGVRPVQQLEQIRAETQSRERELLRLSREHTPDESDSRSRQPGDALTLREIQQSLHPEITVLEYFQVRDQLMVVLLTRDGMEIVKLCKASAIECLLARLRYQMAKITLGTEYVGEFENILLRATQSHLQGLYAELVAPLQERLLTSHLIIIPHGALHHLPFQALYDGEEYLIDKFTISYAPSVSIYSWCSQRSGNSDGPALILAVPDPAIPLVEQEAEALAQILPNPDLTIGPMATTAVLAARGRRSRYIHIATHGYFRQDEPIFSGIRLADTYLSLFDLYQLHLPVELVTLSGCSTGLNAVSAGDEIQGLVRGLICAGVESSLLTLWDVQDRSTSEFMKSFYEYLAAGRNKAEAVRDAVLRLRKSHAHPYYWAPFVLNGKVFN